MNAEPSLNLKIMSVWLGPTHSGFSINKLGYNLFYPLVNLQFANWEVTIFNR
jgi:hypothetical protein